jgi:mannose-6-phosphate isomerase-like protein (cupin superfamily)
MSAARNETGPAKRVRSPVVNLDTAPRAPKVAHDGVGRINVARPFDTDDFETGLMFVERVEIPPGTSIGIHRHGDDEELYFILSGSGRMIVDGVEYRVGAGDLVLNRMGGSHGLLNDSDDSIELLVWQVAFDQATAASPSPGER